MEGGNQWCRARWGPSPGGPGQPAGPSAGREELCTRITEIKTYIEALVLHGDFVSSFPDVGEVVDQG